LIFKKTILDYCQMEGYILNKTLGILIISLLVVGLGSALYVTNQRIQTLQNQVNIANSNYTQIKQQMSQQVTTLQKQNDELKKENGTLKSEVESSKKELSDTQNKADTQSSFTPDSAIQIVKNIPRIQSDVKVDPNLSFNMDHTSTENGTKIMTVQVFDNMKDHTD
jgi:predicted  nucleic acid-binding Zn-ribbon protein